MNNMVLFEIGGAIAEALAIGRHSGIEPEVLLDALSHGSADSFALRNHGRNAMLPRTLSRAGVLRPAMRRRIWSTRLRLPRRRASPPRAPASRASASAARSPPATATATGP